MIPVSVHSEVVVRVIAAWVLSGSGGWSAAAANPDVAVGVLPTAAAPPACLA